MLAVYDETFGKAWIRLLGELTAKGKDQWPRGQATKELLAVTLSVSDGLSNILNSPNRKLSWKFMVAEWLWILSGRSDVASIRLFNKNISMFSDDGESFFGAYGPMIKDQLPYVIKKLMDDIDTRQAVISIWRPSPPETKDVPCTLTCQFLIRDQVLHTIVNMRSSDIWLGLPYDFFNFSMLGNVVASAMQASVGSVTFNLGSSHLYDRDFRYALAVLSSRKMYNDTIKSPMLTDLSTYGPADLRLNEIILELAGAFRMAIDHKTGANLSEVYFEQAISYKYYQVLLSEKTEEARHVLTSFTR